jgi:hypothetical protein
MGLVIRVGEIRQEKYFGRKNISAGKIFRQEKM